MGSILVSTIKILHYKTHHPICGKGLGNVSYCYSQNKKWVKKVED